MNKKINLVIPIAGKGQRFVDLGYKMPKQMIMVDGKHNIDWSFASINYSVCQLIFIVRQDHIDEYSYDKILKKKFGDDIIIKRVDEITRGSVETCLKAKNHINNEKPLVIYTLDVFFEPIFDPLSLSDDYDGTILTFKSNSPSYSYSAIGENGLVCRTAEKKPISQFASVGIYTFKTGNLFVKYAEEMIDKNLLENNEFYIAPLYNLLIRDGSKINHEMVEKMHVMGTPEEFKFFISHTVPSRRFGYKPIALCADHSGYTLKEEAKQWLINNDYTVIDYGTYVKDDCDYNDFVEQAVMSIKSNNSDFAFGFCRTGQGINIAANKHGGIRSALIFDDYIAEMAVRHNSANFFSFPAKYINVEQFGKLINKISTNNFDGGRHIIRVNKSECNEDF